jgi:hypothetical protein
MRKRRDVEREIEPAAVLLCPDCAAEDTRTVLHRDGDTPAP